MAIPAAAVSPCSALNQLELNSAGTAQATPVEALCVRPPQTRLSPAKAGQGSLRVFLNATREPHTVSLREPHPSDALRQAMLHNYLRKLMLTSDEFMELLKEC